MSKEQEYNEAEFGSARLVCPSCHWEGSGTDANLIDLYALTNKREIRCPNCDVYLGALTVGGDEDGGDVSGQLGFQIG